jgi:hypothetical protein
MPLSEDEERIIHEIEQSFYENDPDFYKRASEETLYRHAGRNCKWALAGFIAGLIVLVVSFASSVWLGFVGFLIMLSCAVVFEANARKMGREGWREISDSVRAKGIRDAVHDTGQRLQARFRRH